MMDETQFWSIVETACQANPNRAKEWPARLQTELERLPSEQIVAWNQTFDRLMAEAYRADLWAACDLINGASDDDTFYFFRCWLIGMGRDVFQPALQDADGLAPTVDGDFDAIAEIHAAAFHAWTAMTRNNNRDDYPAGEEYGELDAAAWDFRDPTEQRRHLPRLADLFLDPVQVISQNDPSSGILDPAQAPFPGTEIDGDYVVVEGDWSSLTSQLTRDFLQDEGIAATLGNQHMVEMRWELANATGGVKVLVPRRDAARAITLLAERKAKRQERPLDDDACLNCGSKMPPDQDECESCGWSYGHAQDQDD